MERLKCVMCQGESTQMMRSYVPEQEDCASISNQLPVIFLLRKFAHLPQHICSKLLKEFGDPCSWISWCEACSVLVDKAKNVYEDIERLETQFEKFRVELRRVVRQSEKEKNQSGLQVKKERKRFSEKEPTEIIRSFIRHAKYKSKPFPKRKPLGLLHPKIEIPDNYEEARDPFLESPDGFSALPVDTILKTEANNYSSDSDGNDNEDVSDATPYSNSSDSDQDHDFVLPIKVTRGRGRRSKDDKNKPVSCSHCEKSFATKRGLRRHFRSHIGSDMHPCNVCEEKFDSYAGLRSHREIHKSAKGTYECSKCGKNCQNPSKLKRHEQTLHNREPVERNFPCTLCDKAFGTKKNVEKHLKRHSGPNLHQCKYCGMHFDKYSDLKTHRIIHRGVEKSFTCVYCGKTFSNPSKLTRHERTHTGEKPFPCSICGKTFNQASVLKVHERTHSKEKPYLCAQCGRGFSDRSSYLRHVRITHSGEKPFSCSYCGKACATNDYLKSHERTHTGEKPYNCRVCGQAFSQYSSMKTHERSVHKLDERYSRPVQDLEKLGIGMSNNSLPLTNNPGPNNDMKVNRFMDNPMPSTNNPGSNNEMKTNEFGSSPMPLPLINNPDANIGMKRREFGNSEIKRNEYGNNPIPLRNNPGANNEMKHSELGNSEIKSNDYGNNPIPLINNPGDNNEIKRSEYGNNSEIKRNEFGNNQMPLPLINNPGGSAEMKSGDFGTSELKTHAFNDMKSNEFRNNEMKSGEFGNNAMKSNEFVNNEQAGMGSNNVVSVISN